MKKHKKNLYLWFTLVELIIVITILAILATIAFISFKNYTGNARDGNRLTTLSNLQTWLNLYEVKTSSFPMPDDVYWTWVYDNNWEEIQLNYVWFIKNNISRAVNVNTIPLDPKTNDNYIYWISYNKKYYQIATVLENDVSYHMLPITYANSNNKAKVIWNYWWLITKWNTIYNIPSLIFNNRWKVTLTGNIYFVANNSDNLPYTVDWNTSIQNSDTQSILQLVTGKPSLSVTWVTLPQTTTEFESNSWVYTQLWYNLNTVWKTIFWEEYQWNFPEEEIVNSPPTQDCIFWEWNTSGSIFWECSL